MVVGKQSNIYFQSLQKLQAPLMTAVIGAAFGDRGILPGDGTLQLTDPQIALYEIGFYERSDLLCSYSNIIGIDFPRGKVPGENG